MCSVKSHSHSHCHRSLSSEALKQPEGRLNSRSATLKLLTLYSGEASTPFLRCFHAIFTLLLRHLSKVRMAKRQSHFLREMTTGDERCERRLNRRCLGGPVIRP